MEPRIQYARTSDGVNIAYWAFGEGPALIHLSFYFSHVQIEREIPKVREWYEGRGGPRPVNAAEGVRVQVGVR